MLTLIARLCALCAVSAMLQMALTQDEGRNALRLAGGLAMLHLVISGGSELLASLLDERDLMGIFGILMK